jgi:alkylation response protein AidB-like acyl-CoA dehydrogenase
VVEELADQLRNSAEYAFTEEQAELRKAVRKFSADNFDEQTVRRLMESDPTFDPKVWGRLGAELGVLGLSVSEADGGVGGSLVDQAVAVEELGATLACGPLFGTVYLAIPALVAASAGSVRDALLGELVEGRRTAAFAVVDQAGTFDAAAVAVTATTSGDAYKITGTVPRVVDGAAADDLLVAATGPDGIGLYVVDAADAGIDRTALATLDLTRPMATIELSDAPAQLIAGPEEAERVITHALQVGAALLAVEQVGAAQHMLDVSVEYAKTRWQFGRPIGSFQAVQQRMADAFIDVEAIRWTTWHAAWLIAEGRPADREAAIAKFWAAEAGARVVATAQQVHGGMGIDVTYPLSRYFLWGKQIELALGSASQQLARLGTVYSEGIE